MSSINGLVAWTTIWLAGLLVVVATLTRAEADEAAQGSASKVTLREDVVYGRVHGAALVADIAFPDLKEPLPVIISVHGGRWVGGHKRDASTIKVEQWGGVWILRNVDRLSAEKL